jgi:hypothetical protein
MNMSVIECKSQWEFEAPYQLKGYSANLLVANLDVEEDTTAFCFSITVLAVKLAG